MAYKKHIFKEVIDKLDASVAEYQIVAFKNLSFYPQSFVDFIQEKQENFSVFPMEEKKYTRKIQLFSHTLFCKKYPDIPLYLILFLHGDPQAQKIIRLNHAYDFYNLLENTLMTDWAVSDVKFNFVIYADDVSQNFMLSENAHKESLIHISVNHKFPPHETIN